ncbi:MAG: putative bifunctional diguanylate cyclase/phosphodiesterase [Geminicoccaceae bacterium]
MINGLRWRLCLYAGLLLVPMIVGAQVYQGVGRLGEEIDVVRDLTVGGDNSVRLEVEYYRMRDALERRVGGDPEISPEEIMLRFDIVWSRARGIITAPDFHRFSEESGILPLAGRFLRVLETIEPKVERLEPGDVEELAAIRSALTEFEQELATSAISFAVRRQKRGVELRDDLADLIHHIGRMSAAVAAVFIGILAIVIVEAVFARRSEFDVRRRERHARFLAEHDGLTGLANRSLLAETLRSAFDASTRQESGFHLLALDLDGFKSVNDTHGHQVGDKLLKVIAERLGKTVRGSDMVARLGGDEFAVFMTSSKDVQTTAEIAQRIIDAIERPVVFGGATLHISTSIGIAVAPADGDTGEAILRSADVALYEAKAAGRRTFRFFRADMDATLRQRLHLAAELRHALDTDQLELHFQPQIDLASGLPFGVEALIRWANPSLGPIPSEDIIDIASHSGLIVDLGAWVLDHACRQVAAWSAHGLCPKLAINLSPAQLYHRKFLEMLDETLERRGLPPDRLTLEITEEAMTGDSEAATDVLTRLRRRGITLAIDDFGTGYSSLACLKRLPIQYLKIDRTFVSDIETDANDRAIIHGIINLAASLGLTTIAEGVETERQRDFLMTAGCHLAQGFLYNPAMPEHAILPFLKSAATTRTGTPVGVDLVSM